MDFGLTPQEAAREFGLPTSPGIGANALSDERDHARQVLQLAAHLIARDGNFAILFERYLAREVEDVTG